MSDLFLWAAAALSGIWWAVHTFIGGREVAAPLKSSDLPVIVRATAWLCWHLVTAVLAILTLLFAGAALFDMPGMTLAATLLVAGISVAGVLAAPALSVSYKVLPQGWLFVPVAALGALAVVG